MIRLRRVLLPAILALTLGGCSSPTQNVTTTIRLDITNTAPAEPREEVVPLGNLVRMEVSSEVNGLLHVHGFEEQETLVARDTTIFTFAAGMSGVFEVETHEPDAVWIKLVVS